MKGFSIRLLATIFAAGALLSAPVRSAADELSPAQIEEAASVARHAADAMLRGRHPLFFEAFDWPALISSAVGAPLASRLTERQRDRLEREIFSAIVRLVSTRPDALAAAQPIGASARNGEAWITLMLPVPAGSLKTDWGLKPRHGEWKIEDIRLTDAGRSVREEAVDSLGPPPRAVLRERHADARRAAWPRVAGIAAVLLVSAIFLRHLKGRERRILLFAAAAPAFLFALDGVLAVARVYREPVQLRIGGGDRPEILRRNFQRALSRRDTAAARRILAEAVAAGARPQPLHFVLGRVYEELHDPARAAEEYEQALKPPAPAPGAWVGLARLALGARDADLALNRLGHYLALTTPDAQALSLKAVALGQKRDVEAAQDALAQALALDPEEPALFDIAARLAAAKADAAGAIARLREEERLRPLDRGASSRDPDFRPIEDDPEWKAFLAEKGPADRGRTRP